MTPIASQRRSLWLGEALALHGQESCPALEGEVRADVCIVGGGYAGLWTALRLLELEPALAVTVVEADVCGGGPSGMARLSGSPVQLARIPVAQNP